MGIALLLIGSVVVAIVYGLTSEYRLLVVQPDDDTAPIYAAMVAGLLSTLPLSLSGELLFWHIVLLILTTTLLSGLALLLLGQLKAGAAIEFLPYSVMGGYFATAGWLLAIGGLRSGTGIEYSGLQTLSRIDAIDYGMLAATVTLALFLFLTRKHRLKNLLMVLAMLVSVGSFYLALALIGEGERTAVLGRVSLGQVDAASSITIQPGMLLHAFKATMSESASTIASAIPSFSIIVLLSCVSTLLTIGGLNLLLQRDALANNELRRAGFANIVAGFSGGMAAFPSVGLTSLSQSMGAPPTRWFVVTTALLAALLGYYGIAWVSYLPKPVVGGLLLSMGLGFLYEWLIEARSRYQLHEYLVIPVILLVAIFFGFLQGVLIGLLAATILFVVKYSQTQIIRFEGNGRRFRSNVDRSSSQLKLLQDNGDQIRIIGLQGYLFFGTAGRIYSRVKELLENEKTIRYVVLDFEKVNGIDSSAGLNFDKLSQLVTLNEVYLLIAGLDEGLLGNLSSTGIDIDSVHYADIVRDIDFALEWYEEKVLGSLEDAELNSETFLTQMRREDTQAFDVFSSYLKCMEVEAGDTLANQGDASSELFLLESCGASAYIEDGQGARLRVRRVDAGAVYGEIGFFLGSPRTATIIVDNPGQVFVLTKQNFTRLEQEHPEVISRLQRYLLDASIERLLFTTQTLGTVMR